MGNGIFTRNYDNLMTMHRFPFVQKSNVTVLTVGDKFVDGECILMSKDGAVVKNLQHYPSSNGGYYYNLPFANIQPDITNNPGGYCYTSLFLGSNNTEETYDDYCIQKELSIYNSSGNYDLQYSRPFTDSAVYDAESRCWRKTIHYTFTVLRNCTVGEMGFYYAPYFWLATGSSSFLVYRKAFETPYELVTGDTFKLDFTVVIPANPNQPVSLEVEASAE